jgi:hypothetical protein
MTTPHRRLRSETVSLTLRLGELSHNLDVSLAYDQDNVLRELVFVGRGKIGHGMDQLLHELGIQLSRVIQSRDAVTGVPVS